MNELKMVKSAGVLPQPPLPLPPRTSFFLEHNGKIRSTLDYFALNSSKSYQETCLNTIVNDGGRHLLALVNNADPNNPVSFFEGGVYGGHVNMAQLNVLESTARMIAGVGGSFWPIFFCDESDNAGIRNASLETHQRAFGLLISHLSPYCPGFIIGIESSEYFTKDQHNGFAQLIRHFAPDRYVLMHSQAVPKGGMPDIDAWAFEASWHPSEGDNHSPEELVNEAWRAAANGKYVWPVEYNLKRSQRCREQGRALLNAGFGCGGPA